MAEKTPTRASRPARTSLAPPTPAPPLPPVPQVAAAPNLQATVLAPVAAAAHALPVVHPAAFPLIPAFLQRTDPQRGPGMHTIPTRNGMLDQVRAAVAGTTMAVNNAHSHAVQGVTNTLQAQVIYAQAQVNAGVTGAQAQLDDYQQQLQTEKTKRELEIIAIHASNEVKFNELQDRVMDLYDLLDAQSYFLRQVFTEEALEVLLNRFVISGASGGAAPEPAVKQEPGVKEEEDDHKED